MPLKDVQRRFKAVLTADVKAYNWLVGDDKAAAIRTLPSCQEGKKPCWNVERTGAPMALPLMDVEMNQAVWTQP
jgi:hypothetical protein